MKASEQHLLFGERLRGPTCNTPANGLPNVLNADAQGGGKTPKLSRNLQHADGSLSATNWSLTLMQIGKNQVEKPLLLNCATKVQFFLELTKYFEDFFYGKMHFVCKLLIIKMRTKNDTETQLIISMLRVVYCVVKIHSDRLQEWLKC